jgi:hypothetical protein
MFDDKALDVCMVLSAICYLSHVIVRHIKILYLSKVIRKIKFHDSIVSAQDG